VAAGPPTPQVSEIVSGGAPGEVAIHVAGSFSLSRTYSWYQLLFFDSSAMFPTLFTIGTGIQV
jgi:hypothetical protein